MDVSTDAPGSNIFVDSSGRPLQIFIEDFQRGSTLASQLEKHGAVVSSNAQNAQYIVLDINSEFAREFYGQYSQTSKILDYSWIGKCIEARRPLLEQDDWGGCKFTTLDEQQALPPRLMRYRPSEDPSEMSTSLQSNTGSNIAPFSSTSRASLHTPGSSNSSRVNSIEPALQPHLPNSAFMSSQLGTFIPPPLLPFNPLPQFNPEVLAQMQNSYFLMALADVYRSNMQMNLAAFAADSTQLLQPSPSGSVVSPSAPALPRLSSTESSQKIDATSPSSSDISQNHKRRASSPLTGNLPQSEAQIFMRNGESLVFFVQVDLSQRRDVVNKIKNHGGIITNNQTSADFAILSSRSKTFSILYHIAINSNTPAIMPSFVQDCIEQGRLLPSTSKYLVDAPRVLTKQPSEVVRAKKPQVAPKKQRDKPAVKKLPASVANQSSEINSKVSPNCPPSPPPPPEHTKVLASAGRYQYSPQEREYADTYVKVLFERDHEMTNSMVAQKLHEKMPHHPIMSWNAMVNGQLRDIVELGRKRAGIAFRKNAYNQEKLGLQTENSSEDIDKPVKRQKVAEEEPRDRDLWLLARFFADGGADGIGDDDDRSELWECLHSKGKWRTPEEWMQLYEREHEEVKRLFSEITGQEAEY